MRNPFRHQDSRLHPEATQGQVDRAFASLGWGSKVEREIQRTSGEPLVFRFRMPSGTNLVTADTLAAATQEAPAWVHDGLAGLREAAEQTGVVMVGAIVTEENPTDVLTTVTVVFSEQLKDPRIEIREPAPEEKVSQEVIKISDACTLVDRISAFRPTPGAEPTGLRVNEFMWATPYGGLVMAFASTHSGSGSDRMTNFMVRVAQDSQLVPASAPAG